MANLNPIYEKLIALSTEIGNWIKEERLTFSQDDVEIKGFNNFVSYVDKQAEVRFVSALAQLIPEAGFIAEEGTSDKRGERYNWVIDPLDGTTNYVHDIPCYCTSVALMDGEELVMGVIYEPNSNECFHALADQGAYLNGKPISVSHQPELIQSLLATGFPYDDFQREDDYFGILKEFTKKSRGLRRLGSAALDLAYVACGRFDGFYEYGLNPWDVAAGALIVKEAGGHVSDFRGSKNYIFGEEIIADNSLISEAFFAVISKGFNR
jgi:myo-inositol-1(or 4)-monophosphatase